MSELPMLVKEASLVISLWQAGLLGEDFTQLFTKLKLIHTDVFALIVHASGANKTAFENRSSLALTAVIFTQYSVRFFVCVLVLRGHQGKTLLAV